MFFVQYFGTVVWVWASRKGSCLKNTTPPIADLLRPFGTVLFPTELEKWP